jgi:pyruvate kinase
MPGDDAAGALDFGSPLTDIENLHSRLLELRAELVSWDERLAPVTGDLPESGRQSARNLVHYLAMRRLDLRPLQEALAANGLSSLGRAEPHVLASLLAVLTLLEKLAPWKMPESEVPAFPVLSRADGRALLELRADALFGSRGDDRAARIMVTAPDEAATNYGLVRDLLAGGMDCLRINCAHGDREEWAAMIEHLRQAEAELGVRCRLLMDLAGPRARTGALEPGPQVAKVSPRRDPLGRVARPAELWLTVEEEPRAAPRPADAEIPLPARFLQQIPVGSRLRFVDARDARRSMSVVADGDGGLWAELNETAYITTGTPIELVPPSEDPDQTAASSRVGPLPPLEQPIRLRVGDRLILTRSPVPGRPAVVVDGETRAPGRIPCYPPEVLDDLVPGHSIWFDEGKIGGVIESVSAEEAVVSITFAASTSSSLAPEKGINLPQTTLRLASLTDRDRDNLPFIVEHADMIGYSFVRTADDVRMLYRELDRLQAHALGVVLKIECAKALEQFPVIVLAALQRHAVGVMIARGDLAVECGFVRLAEVQEQLLWLCEASHLPVIWATQVLENLAKHGRPSRAEITDAAHGVRAECVMLNKGRHILDAVRSLNSILTRMQTHLHKNQTLFDQLDVADLFFASGEDAARGAAP